MKTKCARLSTLPDHVVDAVYLESELDEYRGNPFIEALPPIPSNRRLAAMLPERPRYGEHERDLPRHLRTHCILRLLDYFEPLGRHYDIANRVDLIMRSGYRKRNPHGPEFRRRLQENYEKLQCPDSQIEMDWAESAETLAQSMSMALIGVSGVGKTRSLKRALSQYPQAIRHKALSNLVQIPWLIVECPHDGSVKQLCLQFFKTVDRVVGAKYAERFGSKGVTTEQRLLEVAQIARAHAIGVIVFDELQHIRPAGEGGIEKMLNFFVTLVNHSESPVILVGTMAAQHLLQIDFRQGRRATGLGALVWPQFEPGEEWDYLKKEIWKYQWTEKSSPFTEEVSQVFDNRTQGVTDLAVKLYILSQYRAIVTRTEQVTADLMNQVAEEDFALLEPMLDALRSGDPLKIARFDDLRPLDFETTLARENLRTQPPIDVVALQRSLVDQEKMRRAQTLEALRSAGVSAENAALAVETFFNSAPDTTAAQAATDALKLLGMDRPPRRQSKAKAKASIDIDSLSHDDLRRAVHDGKATGSTAHDALEKLGVVRGPQAVFE